METLGVKRVQDRVKGRSVALVGNSIEMFKHRFGADIDSHDVVIRINLGMPDVWPENRKALGDKTTIWACARYWEQSLQHIRSWPEYLVWMKLTKLGDHHLRKLRNFDPPCPILCWSQDLEDACKTFVGADPTTGLRMAWFLRVHCEPTHITVFGMDHWEKGPSHWSRQKNTPNHVPDLERVAMERLGL